MLVKYEKKESEREGFGERTENIYINIYIYLERRKRRGRNSRGVPVKQYQNSEIQKFKAQTIGIQK